MKLAAERGRKTRSTIKLGICGEHGGDPASIHFCQSVGLDYVSCSPYRPPCRRAGGARQQGSEPGLLDGTTRDGLSACVRSPETSEDAPLQSKHQGKPRAMNLQEIEAEARALYEIQEEGWGWDREPERSRRSFARRSEQSLLPSINMLGTFAPRGPLSCSRLTARSQIDMRCLSRQIREESTKPDKNYRICVS